MRRKEWVNNKAMIKKIFPCVFKLIYLYISVLFSGMLKVCSTVLQLGKIEFKAEKNQEQASMPDNTGT